MRRDENVEEVLTSDLPSASSHEAESAGVRVLERLQMNPGTAVSPALLNFDPRRRANWRPIYALAAAAAIVLAVLLPMAMSPSAPAVLEVAARKVHFGETVKSEMFGEIVRLEDGSRVEMKTNSELVLERADDGVRIRLDKGDIVVSAAKQHGHLYVQTKDVMVSVVGTVFYVKAEKEGSRVAVFEGEVHVKQGQTEKKLGPGEQVASNPKMESIPVREQVAWSREAVTHLAFLPQAVTGQKSDEERLAFEVATIRPAGPRASVPDGARGAGGDGSGRSLELCHGSRIQLDPRRLYITEATLYELVGWAFGRCAELVGAHVPVVRVSGGEKWMTSDRWDVEALFPEGSVTPLPTTAFGGPVRELQSGRSPKVQRMLRTLLEDRFNLVIRREMKEGPVYLLMVAPGGPKFQGLDWDYGQVAAHGHFALASPTGQRSDLNRGTWAEGLYTVAQGASTFAANGTDCCKTHIFANLAMSDVAASLSTLVDRPVIDRTGIQEKVSFAIEWPWTRSPDTRQGRGHDLPATFQEKTKALEAAGLLLKDEPKGQVETFVIESAEKPSEN